MLITEFIFLHTRVVLENERLEGSEISIDPVNADGLGNVAENEEAKEQMIYEPSQSQPNSNKNCNLIIKFFISYSTIYWS